MVFNHVSQINHQPPILNFVLQTITQSHFKTTPLLAKQKGEWAEVCFAAEILRRGWRIARPYGDSAPYDCVVDAGAGFRRVQVKAVFTAVANVPSPYRVALVHGYWKQLRYSPQEVDLLAVLIVPRKTWFIVPTSALEDRTLLTFGRTRRVGNWLEKYREAWEQFPGAGESKDNA